MSRELPGVHPSARPTISGRNPPGPPRTLPRGLPWPPRRNWRGFRIVGALFAPVSYKVARPLMAPAGRPTDAAASDLLLELLQPGRVALGDHGEHLGGLGFIPLDGRPGGRRQIGIRHRHREGEPVALGDGQEGQRCGGDLAETGALTGLEDRGSGRSVGVTTFLATAATMPRWRWTRPRSPSGSACRIRT